METCISDITRSNLVEKLDSLQSTHPNEDFVLNAFDDSIASLLDEAMT